MTTTQLFITGATGYIGGSVLSKIYAERPDIEITALLRKPNESFAAEYPKIKVIKGTFDDTDAIAAASEKADIIIHAGDTDHLASVKAILSGLAKRTSKSLLLHLTGTGSISDMREKVFIGKANPRVWNDIDDVQEIYDLPEETLHRHVDKLIADASGDLVKTISISPPDIYGRGTGPGKKTSFLVPEYVPAIVDAKKAFYFGEGENLRSVTHISDVVSLFMLIIDKYLQGGQGLEYGKEGYYFGVADAVKWKDAAQAIVKIGHEQGWLPSEVEAGSFEPEEANTLNLKPPFSNPELVLYLWGSNSRAESARARRLGWEPKGPSFWDELASECQLAAEGLKGST